MPGFIKDNLGHLLGRIREGLRLAPVLLRKPAVIFHWLMSARAAQVALIVLGLSVPTVMTGAVDAALEKMYPPRFHEEIFGMMQKTYTNPRLKDRQELARAVLWGGSGSIVFLLLLLHIPAALKSADEHARELERRADTLFPTEPSKSILLYRTALNFATDTMHINALKEKISSFNEKIRRKPSLSAAIEYSSSPVEDSASTVVIPSPGCPDEPNDRDVSGAGFSHHGPKDRYRITGTLGQGTMGVTHRARDIVLDRDVAIKELLPDLAADVEGNSRFRQEAKVLAQLTHPGIVQIYDFIEEDERIWIVMELVRGGELTDLFKERGYLSVPEAARLGLQMAEAMGYAHARGVVHRDFKPSNVMLTVGGSPKITDFGLAIFSRADSTTATGEVVGSPYYMSPEQAEGKSVDSRSDVYSMGAMLYQMLTGKVPFDGNNVRSVLHQHVSSEPRPPHLIRTGIPEELGSLIMVMLAKDPDERTQDMTGIGKILNKYVVLPATPKTSTRSR